MSNPAYQDLKMKLKTIKQAKGDDHIRHSSRNVNPTDDLVIN